MTACSSISKHSITVSIFTNLFSTVSLMAVVHSGHTKAIPIENLEFLRERCGFQGYDRESTKSVHCCRHMGYKMAGEPRKVKINHNIFKIRRNL